MEKTCTILLRNSAVPQHGLSYRKDNGKLMIAPMTESDHEQAQYVDMFLVTDDEIEEGDWVINLPESGRISGVVYKCGENTADANYCNKHCCKVIASTEPGKVPNIPMNLVKGYVASSHEPKRYGGDIVEVELLFCQPKKGGKVYPNLTNDNEVIVLSPSLDEEGHPVHPNKNKMFTFDEQRMNIMYAISLFAAQKGLTPTSVEMKEVNEWADKWIKENV
jgi:hypothetical protein